MSRLNLILAGIAPVSPAMETDAHNVKIATTFRITAFSTEFTFLFPCTEVGKYLETPTQNLGAIVLCRGTAHALCLFRQR